LFEVLKRRVFERADASSPRVAALPQTIDFIAGFRAIPGSPFLWYLSFGEAKERYSPKAKAFKSQLAAS
jgi:hypothetical protein